MHVIQWFAFIILILPGYLYSQTYYVSTTGSNSTGNGSNANPWASISHALDEVPDGSLILVKPGQYNGRVNMRGSFTIGVEVRSEVPYQAQMRNNDRVFTFYEDARGCHGITLSGFDIAHSGAGSGALVVHIDGTGDGSVYDITLRNNIIHDSYNNDLAKVNNSCYDILIESNMFYNQSGSDEHIDINSAQNVTVRKNIFFNDFIGSGRTNGNNTSSYIVIKDSNGSDDLYLGSSNITVEKNVFLNWEGNTGTSFILCGEDGHPYFEAIGVLIENNLLLGNSPNVMRSAFGSKGCKDVTVRNNTIVGDLPSLAYAFRLNTEGANMPNDNLQFHNNIWSDPNGSMGASNGSANDFSDTPVGETTSWTLNNNFYWNGTNPIPEDNNELINYTDDANRIVADPLLPANNNVTIPRWNVSNQQFNDGSLTIGEAFVKLVISYGTIEQNSPAKNAADSKHAPLDDILDNIRSVPDIGAVELISVCDTITTNQWISGDGDWHQSANNWSLNRLPEACDAVVIPSGVLLTISNGNLAKAYTLDVSVDAILVVNGMAEIQVNNQ